MGLLDQLAGQALGSLGAGNEEQGSPPLMQIAASLLQKQGGLDGLLATLKQGGLAEQTASWVGTGKNQGVSGEELSSALGSGTLSELAGQFGLSSEVLSSGLAKMLPQLIDQLTPSGDTGNSGNLLGSILGNFLNKA